MGMRADGDMYQDMGSFKVEKVKKKKKVENKIKRKQKRMKVNEVKQMRSEIQLGFFL
jgi:hypothetical protein